MEKICGIYCIENNINGKKYVGKGKDIKSRWSDHKGKLTRNSHPNQYLQKSWNKYGEDNFSFYLICECQKEKLDELEILYIKEMKTKAPFGYNLTSGGGGLLDVKHSIESILKMSNSKMGHIVSDETKEKISKSNRNKPRNFSPEYVERLINNFKGKNNPNYGKPMSKETKRKMIETKMKNKKPKPIKKTKKEIKESSNSSSKYLGVSFYKRKKLWRAYYKKIFQKHLGYFEHEEDAATAYDDYVYYKLGEKNNLNFPERYI